MDSFELCWKYHTYGKNQYKSMGNPLCEKKTLTCTNLALYVCQVHSNFGFSLLLTLTKKTKKSPVIFRQNAETENKQTRQLFFSFFSLMIYPLHGRNTKKLKHQTP